MTLQERLEQYGNYETVKTDWDKFEGAEQFEVVGGNASLRDRAIKAIEKDILELIESLTFQELIQINDIEYRNGSYIDANELRLKLKEYTGNKEKV
jgi:hypothetical protein